VRSAGTEVVGLRDYCWGRSAYLRDPDGRVIELQDERSLLAGEAP
jgi:catechol-2,3-dioxygenase